MNTKLSLALLALFVASAQASAQISTTDRVRDRVIFGGERSGPRAGGTVGDVIHGRSSDQRSASKVPKGHLPPRGMCRVWIDGVPPGQQPAVTTCAEAQRDRVQYGANARVIRGDSESFPGKGKGKFKNRDARTTDILGRRVDDDDHDRRTSGKAEKARAKGRKG